MSLQISFFTLFIITIIAITSSQPTDRNPDELQQNQQQQLDEITPEDQHAIDRIKRHFYYLRRHHHHDWDRFLKKVLVEVVVDVDVKHEVNTKHDINTKHDDGIDRKNGKFKGDHDDHEKAINVRKYKVLIKTTDDENHE
jgi:zona occludens toxin (predicted ATPase)